jgi:hypothetical protein
MNKRIAVGAALIVFYLMTLLGSFLYGVDSYRKGYLANLVDNIRGGPRLLALSVSQFFNAEDTVSVNFDFGAVQKIESQKLRSFSQSHTGRYTWTDRFRAKMSYKKHLLLADMRLKGGTDLHWRNGPSASFRVRLSKNTSLENLENFSMQHSDRLGIYEQVFQELLASRGLINSKIFFRPTQVNGTPVGVYAFFEVPDFRLLESNKVPIGPVFQFEKDALLEVKSRGDGYLDVEELFGFQNSPIKLSFGQKLFEGPDWLETTNKARELLRGFQEERYTASEVFDVEALAKFLSTSAVIGHGELDWKDLYFYFNPVSSRFHIIGREYHIVSETKNVEQLWWLPIKKGGLTSHQLSKVLFSDLKVQEKFYKDLFFLTRSNFLENFWALKKEDVYKSLVVLGQYSKFGDVRSHFEKQVNMMRHFLDFETAILAELVDYEKDSIKLAIKNTYPLTVEIGCLMLENKPLACPKENSIVPSRYLNEPARTEYLSLERTKEPANDNFEGGPLSVQFRVLGESAYRTLKINKVASFETMFGLLGKELGNQVLPASFKFIKEVNGEYKFEPGEWVLDKNITFPPGAKLSIPAGTTINLVNAEIKIQGPLIVSGSTELPVVFHASETNSGRLFVSAQGAKAQFENVIFSGITSRSSDQHHFGAGVTVINTDLTMQNVKFVSHQPTGRGLTIIESTFDMRAVDFSGMGYTALSVLFSDGVLFQCSFTKTNGTALHAVKSKIRVGHSSFIDSNKTAIAATTGSVIDGYGIVVENSSEGIFAENLSQVTINDYTGFANQLEGVALGDDEKHGGSFISLSQAKGTYLSPSGLLFSPSSTVILNGEKINFEEQTKEQLNHLLKKNGYRK